MTAVLPLMLSLSFGVLCALTTRKSQKAVSLLGGVIQFGLASWILWSCKDGIIFQVQAGDWPLPYGVSFQIDLLSALMIWISAFLLLGTQIYALETTPNEPSQGFFHSLWHFLSAGVYGSFSTADLFNLYVWFEILLLASFVLMSMGGKIHQLKANLSYVLLNLVGSAFFLLGLGFLYNSTGTLNFPQLQTLKEVGPAAPWSALCLLMAFGMKAGAFPLFAWLPASYPSTAIGPLAMFAGLLTKVGVYTLLRFLGIPSILTMNWLEPALYIIASLTMIIGVYGAAQEMTMRKILSFHIVSQIGYMILGVAVGGKLGLGAALFYLMHHMIVKTNLFLVAGAVERIHGHSELKPLGGLMSSQKTIAFVFVVSALSLAGLPPLSGFWAKFVVLYSAAEAEAYWSLAAGLIVGLLTFYSMIKIWAEAFLKAPPESSQSQPSTALPWTMKLPMLIFALWTIFLGVYPNCLFAWIEVASHQMIRGIP